MTLAVARSAVSGSEQRSAKDLCTNSTFSRDIGRPVSLVLPTLALFRSTRVAARTPASSAASSPPRAPALDSQLGFDSRKSVLNGGEFGDDDRWRIREGA
jgi:hypothetical protein